jgi:hypothetical protein
MDYIKKDKIWRRYSMGERNRKWIQYVSPKIKDGMYLEA